MRGTMVQVHNANVEHLILAPNLPLPTLSFQVPTHWRLVGDQDESPDPEQLIKKRGRKKRSEALDMSMLTCFQQVINAPFPYGRRVVLPQFLARHVNRPPPDPLLCYFRGNIAVGRSCRCSQCGANCPGTSPDGSAG